MTSFFPDNQIFRRSLKFTASSAIYSYIFDDFFHRLDVWNCMINFFGVWNCRVSIFDVGRSTRVVTLNQFGQKFFGDKILGKLQLETFFLQNSSALKSHSF